MWEAPNEGWIRGILLQTLAQRVGHISDIESTFGITKEEFPVSWQSRTEHEEALEIQEVNDLVTAYDNNVYKYELEDEDARRNDFQNDIPDLFKPGWMKELQIGMGELRRDRLETLLLQLIIRRRSTYMVAAELLFFDTDKYYDWTDEEEDDDESGDAREGMSIEGDCKREGGDTQLPLRQGT